MAGEQFTIERGDLFQRLRGDGPQTLDTTDDVGEISAEWLDGGGEPLGDAGTEELVFPPSEWPAADRSIRARGREPVIITLRDAPEQARSIRFSRDGRSATFAAASGVPPWVTQRKTRVFGGNATAFEIPVFSEFYTGFARFEAKVGDLYAALKAIPPFDRVEAAGKLRMVGYFAPSTAPGGHFKTVIEITEGERRIHGDAGTARRRLAAELKDMPALILIDSPHAGGAGGMLHNDKPYWPAWASLGSMGAGAGWEEVAIHELAHGFGLSDEYSKELKDRPPRYGNVSNAPTASGLVWNDIPKLPGATALPTHRENGSMIATTPILGPVAAFQGAYYSQDHWRPTVDCRMRTYEPRGFCPVCSRIILKRYGM